MRPGKLKWWATVNALSLMILGASLAAAAEAPATESAQAFKPKFQMRGYRIGDPKPSGVNDDHAGGRTEDWHFGPVELLGGLIRGYDETGLVRVAGFFHLRDFQTMEQHFTATYGTPDSRVEKASRNPAGKLVTNIIIRWEFDEGTLILEKYGPNMNPLSGFRFKNRQAEAREIAKEKQLTETL
ncbi:MAG: hypothetical protein ACKO0Z_20550 [Betaproteobacteria bacterium]